MLTVSLIRDSNNAPQYAVGMIEDITERRETIESLRKSEELFSKAFLDNPSVMSINSLKNYKYIEVNKSFEQYSGYNREEVIGKIPTEIGLWVTNDELKRLIDGLIEKRKVRNSEFQFRTKNGEMLVVSLSTDIVEFGGEQCFLSSAQDITERKRVEKKLLESEERFRVLFEHSPAGIICVYGSVGSVKIMVNNAYAGFTGYSRNELEEMSLEEINMTLFFPEDRKKEEFDSKKLINSMNFEYEGERRFRHKNGHIIYAYEGRSLIHDEKTGFYQFISVTQDITERKLAEDARLESEQRLFDIIDFFPDPVLVIDPEGIVLAWNRAMENLSGIKAIDIIGKGSQEYSLPFFGERCPMLVDLVFKSDREAEKRYSEIGWSGNILHGEAFMPNLRGGTAYLFGTAAVLRNFKGDIVGAIESIRDITERKHAELEKERLIAELKKALSEIETLQGLIPICSFCKKIRDDEGYWEQIEKYISQRSKAFFSHGICPDCMKKYYPDFSGENENNNKKRDN